LSISASKILFRNLFLIIICFGFSKIGLAQTKLRPVEELIGDTSGLDFLPHLKEIARNKYEILPAQSEKAKLAIYQTQVTAHSNLGAIIYCTGGILIDDGWIRILGSGNPKLDRSLPDWNKGKAQDLNGRPGFLLIADDVIGGFFAINGGAFGPDLGKVFYLAPDDLKWENQNMNYLEFIQFCFVGNMN
jgi:uncharacterized protein DUF2625